MSANNPNRIGLLGTIVVAALAVGLATPAFAQRSRGAERAGTAEFGLQLMDFPGTHVTGEHGASLDVDSDLAWGLVGGYNFTDKFQLGGNITWASPDYRLKLVPDSGSPWPTVNASMDISTFILTGTFHFLDGPLTPYVQVGAGWVHVDSNVVNGTPSTGCWWDPWWGYVCTTFYDTYSDTNTAYTYSAGVRWDVNESIALRAAYGKLDMNASHASKDVNLDTWRAEIVWKF